MKKLLKLSMLSTSVALSTGLALGMASGANAQGACSVAYTTANSWGNGAQIRTTITNTGAARTSWELCWTYAGSDAIQNLWDGTFTQTGKNVCVKNAGYNGNLPANGTASFGFIVNNPGAAPTAFTLNGTACGGSASSTPSSTPVSSSTSSRSSTPSSSSSSISGTAARWLLDDSKSTFHFVTVKKNSAGTETPENITFSQFQGTVAPSGQATLTIPLASISSGVDLRNTRLKEILFESQYLPSLHFTTQLDLSTIDAMAAGSTKVQSVTGNLVLHGVVKSVVFDALIVKHANNSLSVSPRKPIVINAIDFDLAGGVESLRSIMTLTSIGEKVPVYFKMFLNRDNPSNVPAISLPGAPATPLSLTGTAVTAGANLNWADASSNETGFLVRRKGADGRWVTAANNNANTVSYVDAIGAGTYDYKVISYVDSIPSTATSPLTLIVSGNGSTSSSSTVTTSSRSSSSVVTTSSRSSTSTTSASSSSIAFVGDATTGRNLYSTAGCQGCHRDNDGDGRFTDGAISFDVNAWKHPINFPQGNYTGTSVTDLARFINQVMLGSFATCTAANCGEHLAAYLWSLRGKTQDNGVACDTSSPVQYGIRSVKLLTSFEYHNSMQALFNRTLPKNYGSKELANPDKAIASLPNHLTEPVSEARLLSYQQNAQEIANWAITNSAISSLNCSDTTSSNCANSFVDNFVYLAFRRPLTTEERTEYAAIVRNSPTGLRWAIQTVLMSPQFLYRTELGIPVSQARSQSWGRNTVFQSADGTAYALDPYEFASALAYIYTGSAPDRTLLSAAANGQLENASSLSQQIDRLLDSDLGKAQIGRFAGMWFRTDDVVNMTRNSTSLTQAVKDSMAQEIREIYKYAFYNNLPFTDIYTGDYTVLNSTLSQYYGVSGGGTNANDWRMVNTANSRRGGVLASGAFMTVNAHAGRTSPIKRAVHVRQDLLCQNIPLPTSFVDDTGLRDKAAADAQVALEAGNLTTTQFYDMQTSVPGTPCWQCHNAIINPLFGVDDFDHLGMPRRIVNGKVVQKAMDNKGDEARSNDVEIPMVNNGGRLFGANGVGTVGFYEVNAEKDGGSPGLAFSGSKDLGRVMVANDLPGVNACLIQKSFRFATGYALSRQFQDDTLEKALTAQQQGQLACVADTLESRLAASNGNPRAMLKELGMSNLIRFRR